MRKSQKVIGGEGDTEQTWPQFARGRHGELEFNYFKIYGK